MTDEEIRRCVEEAQRLDERGSPNDALRILAAVLHHRPESEDARDAASLVLWSRLRQGAEMEVEMSLADDLAFDPLFAECDLCGASTIPNPITKMAAGSWSCGGVTGVWAECDGCGQVACGLCRPAEHRVLPDGRCVQPYCDGKLKPLEDQNGRSPRSWRLPADRVRSMLFLRECPLPPSEDYVQKRLSQWLPELYEQPSRRIHVAAVLRWAPESPALGMRLSLLGGPTWQATVDQDNVEIDFYTARDVQAGIGWAVLVAYRPTTKGSI